jgi:hypothetical protein
MRPATATSTTEAMPAALLGELCAISCRPVLEAEDGLAGWRHRIPPYTAISGRAPSAGGGQFWLVLAGDAAVDGLPSMFEFANSRGRWKMFTPSPKAPSSPAGAAVDDGNLGSAQRMRPKEAQVQPMLADQ